MATESDIKVNMSTKHKEFWALKEPCKDCPFKRTSAPHQGVFEDLPTLAGSAERGTFVHTCHKTDPRSDGFKPGYKGKIRHCAGSLGMMKNMGPKYFQYVWLHDKHGRVESLKPHKDVFNSLTEMVRHYYNHFIKTSPVMVDRLIHKGVNLGNDRSTENVQRESKEDYGEVPGNSRLG